MSQFGPNPTINVVFQFDASSSVDKSIWICPDLGCKYQLVSAQGVHSTVGGASAAGMPDKCTGTTAPGAGTDLCTTAFDFTAAVNVVQTKTLTTNEAARLFNPGDRLTLDFSGTMTGLVGAVTSFIFQPFESGV